MTKPSLKSLMEQQKKPRNKKRGELLVAPTPPAPLPPPADIDAQKIRRPLLVRRFVTELLKNGWDGAAAYREANGKDVKGCAVRACELLKCEDVRTELHRQLQGIITNADLDEDYVYRQYRAMANSNIFDYFVFNKDGSIKELNLDPEKLTLEQQLNVREMKWSPITGKLVSFKLVDRKGSVDSIAKARKMFMGLDDAGLHDIAKEITERMQKASKQVRTFDNATGEEI